MTKAITHTYNLANEYRLHAAYILMGACAILIFFYAVNVYRVISHTVALQKVTTSLTSIGSAVGDLDAHYLALSSQVTPDSLSKYGLTQTQVSEFISRTSTLGTVATIGHEL